MKWFSAIATELNVDCGFTKCVRQIRLQEFNSDLHYAPKLLVTGLCPRMHWKTGKVQHAPQNPLLVRGCRFIKDRDWGDEDGKGKGWRVSFGTWIASCCQRDRCRCSSLWTVRTRVQQPVHTTFSPSHSVHSWSLKSFNRFNACRVSILATVFRCTRYSEYPRW